MRRKTKRIL